MNLEPYEIPIPDSRPELERAINRIQLATYAVQEAHYELPTPQGTEQKADILLAAEALALEVFDLLNTARTIAWGPDHENEEDRPNN